MTSFDFQTTTHAKWILSGEHAVLRGSPAIVAPNTRYYFHLAYKNTDGPLRFINNHGLPAGFETLLHELLNYASKQCNQTTSNFTGTFYFDNTIPIGMGMGGSAALCVALARWFVWSQRIDKGHVLAFARKLENFFHQTSSGLDIIGVAQNTGFVYYTTFDDYHTLEIDTPHHLYLSDSGHSASTKTCIQQVNYFIDNNPKQAKKVDQAMAESVRMAYGAITQNPLAIQPLADALNLAYHCYQSWGLLNDPLEKHCQQLRDHGALAVKPTGSGLGGAVISLWQKPPHDITSFSSL